MGVSSSALLLLLLLVRDHVMVCGSPQTMRVIGAGLGRTGTNSLKMALDRLGFKTYHMDQVLSKPGHLQQWAAMVGDGVTDPSPESVERLLDFVAAEGYNASVDGPINYLFEQQMERDPDARVVLSLRSSGHVWAESALETITRGHYVSGLFPINMLMPGFHELSLWIWRSTFVPAWLGIERPSVGEFAAGYDRWEAHVRATVPADKLLVHRSADGWKPLCDFIGLPVPDEPYPRAPNDRQFMKRIFSVQEFVVHWWVLIGLCLVFVLVGVVRCCFRCLCRTAKAKRS